MIKVKMHFGEILDGIFVKDDYAIAIDNHTVFLVKVLSDKEGDCFVEDVSALLSPTLEERITYDDKEALLEAIKEKLLSITLFDYLTKVCKNKNAYNLGLLGVKHFSSKKGE